jgi:tetratricopeptide (TPR) repeat protein
MVNKFRASWLAAVVLSIASSARGQTPAQPPSKQFTSRPIRLTGDDARRSEELDMAIGAALLADRWDEGIARTEELLALRVKIQGPKHFETVNTEWRLKTLRRIAPMPKDDRAAYLSAVAMNEQVEALNAQAKYAQARPLSEKALEIRRRLLSDDHPDTATSYENMAHIRNSLGKFAEAQPLYEKALALRRRLLGDDHPDTAMSYNNVAYNLNALGKFAEAQPLYEKALAIQRQLLTDDHADTASFCNNLAANLLAQGKYAAAQPLFEKALEIRRQLFTDNHRHTAQSYYSVAANLHAQGKYAEAQPLYEKALEINRRLLTEDHPSTAGCYSGLAANLNDQGKYASAQPLFEKSLEIQRRLFTDDHPETAGGYNNLAYNLYAQGEYAAAQPFYEKALEINRRLLTDEHPRTALTYNNLAGNLVAQGKHAAAQAFYEKALAIYRRLLTDYHPVTANGYHNLAYSLGEQGKYAAAQPLYEKAIAIRRRLLADDHPHTALSYNNLAMNLHAQRMYAQAQPLFEKALEINRRLLTDDHPGTALNYNNLASNLNAQGKFVQAQPLCERALEVWRRLLTDGHPHTAAAYHNLAQSLEAQGKYDEARRRQLNAVRSLDAVRLKLAFTGLDRASTVNLARPKLAAVLARLGESAEAWQALEADLGRGLLDELAARQDRRLAANERERIRQLTAELERLDKLAESTPKGLDRGQRAARFEELKHQREVASIALGELQSQLALRYGASAGRVARLEEIQTVLPTDAALVAWVELPPVAPNAADPDGEHWGVVVRSRGTPAWVPITGTGKDGFWTREDTGLLNRVRTELLSRPSAGLADLRPLLEKLRDQRLAPLAKALGTTTDGLPPARELVALPSRAMAGIPIEALLAPDDTRTVSYAPSGTVFKYLREQRRSAPHAGLLALGDPVYKSPDKSGNPKPPPNHGLLVNTVIRGANAANHGLKEGDVLLAYNGLAMNKKDDLKVVTEGDKPIPIEIWRDGVASRKNLAPGKLGVTIDSHPAPEAIIEQRKLQQALSAARSGEEDFVPLPATRLEVEAITKLFDSDNRPTRALLGTDASESELDRLASTNELKRFAFIHLATHGVIDEAIPQRSAVILTQIGLPDPLDQVLNHKPVFDGRLLVREIQRSWDLKAELVTLSACETALGREAGGEGFVGFTQALLMSGARSVCLSLWKVDDKATSLLMARFYQDLLGKRTGLSKPMPKAEALQEAKQWLRTLTVDQVDGELAALGRGDVRPLAREKGAPARKEAPASKSSTFKPYEHPHFWAAFVLVGDPD